MHACMIQGYGRRGWWERPEAPSWMAAPGGDTLYEADFGWPVLAPETLGAGEWGGRDAAWLRGAVAPNIAAVRAARGGLGGLAAMLNLEAVPVGRPDRAPAAEGWYPWKWAAGRLGARHNDHARAAAMLLAGMVRAACPSVRSVLWYGLPKVDPADLGTGGGDALRELAAACGRTMRGLADVVLCDVYWGHGWDEAKYRRAAVFGRELADLAAGGVMRVDACVRPVVEHGGVVAPVTSERWKVTASVLEDGSYGACWWWDAVLGDGGATRAGLAEAGAVFAA